VILLNPAWSFSSGNAIGWQYSVSGGKLNVFDIFTDYQIQQVLAEEENGLPTAF